MQLNTTVLFVQDIHQSRSFYSDVMQLTVEHDFGTNITFKEGIAIWQLNESHPLAGQKHNDSNAFELYFEEGDIERVVERLENHRVKFFHSLIEEPWGQLTVRFFDPDGHLIEIGEPLDVFLNRMYQQGMDMQQIHQKSGVPLNTLTALIDHETAY